MLRSLFNFLSSLRLTVVLLTSALILVFIGTLAQVKLGLYVAQEEYFRSFFVWWSPGGKGDLQIPVFPAGWLLGTLLLFNLLAAHIKRFKFTWKKIGIFLTHAGLIFLLVGQFFTELFQVESILRLHEGEAKKYSEDSRKNELVIIDVTGSDSNKVVSIPESFLKQGGEIRHPELPFGLRVKNYFQNSTPAGKMDTNEVKIGSTHGIGKRLMFAPMDTATKMDDENKPSAVIEVLGDKESSSEWIVSTWLNKYPWFESLNSQMGELMDGELEKPQSFTHAGRTYEISLRPIRYYKPYSITLLKATHEKYAGTEMAKNFASRIRIDHPAKGENREVLIYMNNPLRYEGETYFQFQMNSEPGMESSALQVVRNPAAITPYVSCIVMGLGMVVQFLMHLVGFARRGRKPAVTAGARGAQSITAEGAQI